MAESSSCREPCFLQKREDLLFFIIKRITQSEASRGTGWGAASLCCGLITRKGKRNVEDEWKIKASGGTLDGIWVIIRERQDFRCWSSHDAFYLKWSWKTKKVLKALLWAWEEGECSNKGAIRGRDTFGVGTAPEPTTVIKLNKT